MIVTLAAVISLDGKITNGDDPHVHAWSSKEDWAHFVQLRSEQDCIIMDRVTYEVVKPEPQAGILRIVLTNHPDLYQAIPGQLEFITATPRRALAHARAAGCQHVLLAGGSTVSSDFLRAGVVNELYITFEPVVFGTGTPLLAARALDVQLRLKDVQQLNATGTLLVHYQIV